MFLPNALATLLCFLPSESRAELSVPPADSNPGFAIQLGVGATYGGAMDEDGDIDVDNPLKGYEFSGGIVSAPPARSIFLDAQLGYSPKVGYYDYDLSILRFRCMVGPNLRVGSRSRFRIGMGLGFTKAISGEGGGTAPSLHGMIGYLFPLDDHIGGFSLNYARTLGKIVIAKRTETGYGGWKYSYRHSIHLHDLALKFDWHIPIGAGRFAEKL